MKSLIAKRSIFLAGRKTSVGLEDEFWTALKKIANERHMTLSDSVGAIDAQRQHGNPLDAQGVRAGILSWQGGREAG